MKSSALETEFGEAWWSFDRSDALILTRMKIPPLMFCWGMIGRANVRFSRCGDVYTLGGKERAYLIPVRTDELDAPTPKIFVRCGEMIDIVAYRPEAPAVWALRTGSAQWLGVAQYRSNSSTRFFRTPLGWLQASGEGICLLTQNAAEQYLILTQLERIAAQDRRHAAELRRILERPLSIPEISVAT